MKTVTIEIPDDCEVKIVKKEEKKESVIRTYQDLIDNDIELHGFFITNQSWINSINGRALNSNKLIAASEKVAKSMLAMAQISQLMPYYGGEITDKEWNSNILKYAIERDVDKNIVVNIYRGIYYYLAFHTAEQRDNFLKWNLDLVKDYLMID